MIVLDNIYVDELYNLNIFSYKLKIMKDKDITNLL